MGITSECMIERIRREKGKRKVFVFNKRKLYKLFEGNLKKLNVDVVQTAFDDMRNLHVLCRRKDNDLYIVWTAYNTGEQDTSYSKFCDGRYNLDLKTGKMELAKRSGINFIFVNSIENVI